VRQEAICSIAFAPLPARLHDCIAELHPNDGTVQFDLACYEAQIETSTEQRRT